MRTFFIFQLVAGFLLTIVNSDPDPRIYLVDTKTVPRFTQHTSINATKQKTSGNDRNFGNDYSGKADIHGSTTGNDYFLGGFFKKLKKAFDDVSFDYDSSSEESRSYRDYSYSARSSSSSEETGSSAEEEKTGSSAEEEKTGSSAEDEKQRESKSSCTCGVKRKGSSNRIIGGSQTEPHEYPWMVRLRYGCSQGYCTGALISDRHIATAYHCLTNLQVDPSKPCDHSDGKREAVIGAHFVEIKTGKEDGKVYPVRKYLFPKKGHLREGVHDSHDFAIYELDHPIEFNDDVSPICLPKDEDEDYEGKKAIAAGWGDYRSGKHDNSDVLRHVELTVYKQMKDYPKMFETLVEENESGEYKDPCSGDSGGPLMYKNKNDRLVLIGTVQGGGYNCDEGKLIHSYGDKNQKWNRITAHLDFLKDLIGSDACAWDY